ncbi:uncharacterized protein [Danio rerio]|uniref:Uncharacterized protein n=1 Tax=Danio rerio TaxID=7955 RepID=A0AC58G0E1_DANRE
MPKRKSKTTVLKAPKRTQTRAKQQKSAEETNLQSVEENQTSKSENNSHNASCSYKLDEPQVEHSALQVIQTTEFPNDPGCSLEIKTSRDDNDDDGNNTNPPEVSHENEQTAVITMQTPDPENSAKYILSKPINVQTANVDQCNTELDDDESENTNNSNHESQKIPDFHSELLDLSSDETGIKLPHEDVIASKMAEQLGSSDIIAQTKDEGSADPLVKRKKRKRMGMCRLGERKRMVKEPMTSRGQEDETREVISEDGLSKVNSNNSFKNESNTEMEIAEISSLNACSVEDVQPDVQHGNELQILVESMSRVEEITHKVDPTTMHHADSDALERNKVECMDHGVHEGNIRVDPLLCAEMCKEITAQIGSMANVDLEEESTNVLDEEAVLKEAEASGSTSEVANYFEQHVSGEPSSPHGCDKYACVSEQCEEFNDFIDHKTLMSDIGEMCESLDDALVSATVSAESKANCEERSTWSLSLPPAPPGGEDKDVQVSFYRTPKAGELSFDTCHLKKQFREQLIFSYHMQNMKM